jgi:hypothetical protein
MKRRLVAVLALSLLAGCARYWASPGGTEGAFDATKARCQSAALARFPSTGGNSIDRELIVPKPDLCVAGIRDINCMSNGGQGTSLRMSQSMSEPAREMFASCMAAAGWRPVANAAEGDAVTRGMVSPRAGG